MTTQDWINEQKIQPVQDRLDGKYYWTTDNLYTEADLVELLEAFALYNDVGRSELFKCPTCCDTKVKDNGDYCAACNTFRGHLNSYYR